MVEVLSHGFDERLKVTSAGRRVLRDIPTLLFRSNAAFLAGRVTEILGNRLKIDPFSQTGQTAPQRQPSGPKMVPKGEKKCFHKGYN